MTQGLIAEVIENGESVGNCLIIGRCVPRIHSSDGLPVYLVTEHASGVVVLCKDRIERTLVVYPSAWPGPGALNQDRCIVVNHEFLPWDVPLLLFDRISK